MEFTRVDSFQVTLSGVTTIDASKRGGSSIILKNPTGNASMYIGPATNEAGSALSSTTGFVLAAGETVAFDITLGSGSVPASGYLSVVGTDTQKLHVLVLKP